MLIFNKKRFIQAAFDSEEEIEKIVAENATDIFGASSIYFPKSLIKTGEGVRTIPDGFVIDLAERRWFVVEVETSKHPVWDHIARQVAKQVVAASQPSTRKLLVDIAVKRAQQSPEIGELFADLKIHQMDVRKFLDEIVQKMPIVGIPIDGISKDLEDWAKTLNIKVRLWLIKKYVELGNPTTVLYEIPDDARPVLDTIVGTGEKKELIAKCDVTIGDLIKAGLLKVGEKLTLPYKPRTGDGCVYEGIVGDDGSITVLGKTFLSPSYAAVYAIQHAGSSRKTVNGWTTWRTSQEVFLSDLREQFLKKSK